MTKIEIIITQNNLIKLTNVWSTFSFNLLFIGIYCRGKQYSRCSLCLSSCWLWNTLNYLLQPIVSMVLYVDHKMYAMCNNNECSTSMQTAQLQLIPRLIFKHQICPSLMNAQGLWDAKQTKKKCNSSMFYF